MQNFRGFFFLFRTIITFMSTGIVLTVPFFTYVLSINANICPPFWLHHKIYEIKTLAFFLSSSLALQKLITIIFYFDVKGYNDEVVGNALIH